MKTKSISLFLLVAIFSLGFTMSTQVFAEGGGGLDCPETSGPYTYLAGSASYQEEEFEEGNLAVLSCEYMKDFTEGDLDIFGQIKAVYHIDGQLSQELIEEYGCGAVLGEQFSPTYVSSVKNFASVAFSTPALLNSATEIMTQIEEQNLATVCTEETLDEAQVSPTAENVKETIEKHEVIDDESIEISNEEVTEENIEEIIEKIIRDEEIKITKQKSAEIVLPNWIKNNAEWWASDLITNDDFSTGIEYMIKEGIIKVPSTEVAGEASDEIPDWVKNNAEWWADDLISDEEYVNALQYLISVGIISVS
ncbi:MAG: hypothetical protein O6761_08860 [Thaumarchaeota archaeon]|nr:hypothetical protein [Nitrososphaerota archaeon]